MKVAVVGLGTMGGPMAGNLIKAGFEITVHNRTRSREEDFETLGATRAETPAAAAAHAAAASDGSSLVMQFIRRPSCFRA